MERQAALKIIQQLADGVDPHSGEVFPSDSPYQHPDTIRALFFALHALETRPVSRQPAGEGAPENAGKPWSEDEDKALASAFDAGRQIPELAAQHKRTRVAIQARLVKLGKIEPPADMPNRFRAAASMASYVVQH
ncbi:MAG: hypothetical protein HY323_15195 [Betaproteobacteria bacterium]|nr:hypothetical protein [Betaproteobacteria bacterium]